MVALVAHRVGRETLKVEPSVARRASNPRLGLGGHVRHERLPTKLCSGKLSPSINIVPLFGDTSEAPAPLTTTNDL